MRILYGVVGEGMGHATRSRVVLEHLLLAGHDVHVVVSGRAHAFFKKTFDGRSGIAIEEIEGLTLSYGDNKLDLPESIASNIGHAPKAIARNVESYARFKFAGYKADVVVSDFESWAYLYGINNRLSVVSIDNMQVINRCAHEDDVTDGRGQAFQIAKAAVKVKLPGAYHYLVSSFFFPPVRKPRTTLVPPILRPEIIAAKREPRDHVLVYQTSPDNQGLLDILKTLPFSFRVYGMGREGIEANLTFRPFSQEGFIDDLRTARAVIAGGGYSLMSECVHLGVPMLSVPIGGQYEQELNARYLQKLGYGAWAKTLDREAMEGFLADLPRMTDKIAAYPRRDNGLLFSCLTELLDCAAARLPPPERLQTPAMGGYEGGKAE
ncbi:MAG: teichoic acid biosynthesis protein [Deltaproteobacteria bacterium]|nr:teichoic acid biosynthesis protein [Deltaproteobacteria bacterium]